jgi:two-component SAPR family response regulator
MILHGEFDPVYPANLSMIYSSYIKHNRFIIVPNASNLITMDQPVFVANCLDQFVKKPDPVQFSMTHQLLVEKLNHIIQTGYRKEAMLAALDIKVIEQFSVKWKGHRVIGKWSQRRARELLLYLTIHKKVPRSELLSTFHPDKLEEDAKNSLRVQLAHLKSIFQQHSDESLHHALVIKRDYVSINTLVECDLVDYIRDIERLMMTDRPLKNRMSLYHRLIEIFSSNFLAEYGGEWVHELSTQIEWKLTDAFIYLLDLMERKGQYFDAKRLVSVSQSVEPYDGFCDERSEMLTRKM